MNRKINTTLISQYRNVLFGIATIFVLLTHSSEFMWPDRLLIIPKILQQGSMGVDIFLFLSGMGLFFSMSKGTGIGDFYRKRCMRIMPTYFLIAVPGFAILDLIIKHAGWKQFLENVTSISYWKNGGHELWYVPFILALYLCYPLIFKLLNSKRFHKYIYVLIAGLIVLNIILLFQTPEFYGKWERSLSRIPVFLIGCEMATRIYNKREVSLCIPIVATFIYIGLRGFIFINPTALSGLVIDAMIRFSYIFSTVAVVCLIPLFFEKFKWDKLLCIFNWFGTRSLEIYLLHMMLYVVYLKSEIGVVYNSVVFYFVGIIPVTLLIVWGVELGMRKMKSV